MHPVPLSPSSLAALLQADAPALAIEVVPETGSTNADLLGRLAALDGPVLRAAELQTAGRGRAGRSWQAPEGGSLAFSLAWPFFRRGIPGLVGLPLAVGVMVCDALARFGLAVRLKWPNDLLLDDAKLGGILIETGTVQQARHVQTWAVIGIGINIALPEAAVHAIGREVAQAPQLLAQRNAVLAAIAQTLAQQLPRFDEQGFAAFEAAWNRVHAWPNREVCVLDQGRVVQQGRAIGVDSTGCLLLQTPAGEQAVHAGDVSLRPASGLKEA